MTITYRILMDAHQNVNYNKVFNAHQDYLILHHPNTTFHNVFITNW